MRWLKELYHKITRRPWPVKTSDGRWDVALRINEIGLESQQIVIQHIRKAAQDTGIFDCKCAGDIRKLSAHTLVAIGHYDPNEKPNIVTELSDAGTALWGKVVCLISCGDKLNVRSDISDIVNKSKAASIRAFHMKLSLKDAYEIFIHFIRLANEHPHEWADVLMSRAERIYGEG